MTPETEGNTQPLEWHADVEAATGVLRSFCEDRSAKLDQAALDALKTATAVLFTEAGLHHADTQPPELFAALSHPDGVRVNLIRALIPPFLTDVSLRLHARALQEAIAVPNLQSQAEGDRKTAH